MARQDESWPTKEDDKISSDTNPYEPPHARSSAIQLNRSNPRLAPTSGPALVVGGGYLLGAVAAIPLVITEQMIGYFGMVPGAIVGGLAYRVSSAAFQIDPSMRVRRRLYACLAATTIVTGVFSFMAITRFVPALGGQALGVSAGGFVIGLYLSILIGPFAVGMVLSGDRRAGTAAQSHPDPPSDDDSGG